jgi:hypothetical protein
MINFIINDTFKFKMIFKIYKFKEKYNNSKINF